jgi:DNA-binding protein WhiA
MSFSSTVKQELIEIPVKTVCCRRAFLYGALMGAKLQDDKVLFCADNEDTAAYVAKLIKECFGKDADVHYEVYVGRPRYTLCFESARAIRFLRAAEQGKQALLEAIGKTCGHCINVFLRGAFVALGTVSEPTNSYHAELSFASELRAECLDELLAELGIPCRKIIRKNKIGLYYKSSAAIEEFFAEMGASRAVFDLVNAKIEREIRNNENRATNCDARNIARAVEASQKQMAAIIHLMDCGMLDSLDEDLRKTAKLRMEYGEVSLSELAALHEPPISKSGLNHRLAKLCELAEKLK